MIHGLDFGRYTTWARPDTSPKPIDFVVVGVTSGNYRVQTFEANKEALLLEKRGMTYHFYQHNYNWKTQAELFAKASEEVGSKALWWDYERSTWSQLDKRTALETAEALNWLGARFPRVGIYANIYDFVALFQKFVPQTAKNVEWWVAYPADPPVDVPRWQFSWGTPNRPFESCRMYQYSWKGNAQEYGATNDKKSMDLNWYLGDDIDEWLGVEPQPTGCEKMLDELQAFVDKWRNA